MEQNDNSKPRRSSIKERVEKMLTRNSVGARPNSVEDDEKEIGTRKRRSTNVKDRALFLNNKIKEGKLIEHGAYKDLT